MTICVEVFDLRGRSIRTLVRGTDEPGTHTAVWDGSTDRGRAAGSGVYMIRASGDGLMVQRKGVLMK